MSSKYYKKLDIIRVLSCIAILFYHLGVLKGGYLAVCTFFVLSGYLSVITAFKKDKFSFKDYYLNKLKKIYLPLLVVVLLSIAIISLIPSIDWINLKPETTSVLLGYNNYWQLNANLDYFVRHISSPFMHLWYIAILIQFELVFPLIFIGLKKIGEKIHKLVPCILLGILGIVSYIFFYIKVQDGNLMSAYYDTFTRSFSLLLGLSIGFIHHYYKPLVFNNNTISKLAYILYLLVLFIIFLLVDVTSSFFTLSMIVTTLISIRLIDYSIKDTKPFFIDKIIKSLSKVSYEIYLVQYPVIFLLQSTKLPNYIIILLTLIITLLISYIINISYSEVDNKFKIVKKIFFFIILFITIFGLFKYIITKDYTKEMKELSDELSNNRKLIEEKQKQYQEKHNKEESAWEKLISDMNSDEEDLKELVTNLNITGVGDSIMELCVKEMYEVFPKGYFDAAENRTEYRSIEIIKDLDKQGLLGDVVVLSLGTNGKCLGKCKDMLMEALGNRKVYWLNATHPDFDTFNPSLIETAKKYDNLKIIDWVSIVKPHPEYLIRDGIHPNVKGRKFYAEAIYNAIYNDYLEEFNKQKESKIEEHNEYEKNRKTFIGNDLLIGLYDYLIEDSDDYEFIIDKEFNYKKLKSKIEDMLENDTISDNIIFLLDEQSKLTKTEYKEIVKLLNNKNIYIVDLYNELDIDDVTIIDFSKELKNNHKIDNIHLTDKGNELLRKKINSHIKTDK